jgi:hypothetical protein
MPPRLRWYKLSEYPISSTAFNGVSATSLGRRGKEEVQQQVAINDGAQTVTKGAAKHQVENVEQWP